MVALAMLGPPLMVLGRLKRLGRSLESVGATEVVLPPRRRNQGWLSMPQLPRTVASSELAVLAMLGPPLMVLGWLGLPGRRLEGWNGRGCPGGCCNPPGADQGWLLMPPPPRTVAPSDLTVLAMLGPPLMDLGGWGGWLGWEVGWE